MNSETPAATSSEQEEPQFIISPPDYKQSINSGESFYIQFHILSPDVESAIIRILHRYLEKYDLLYIKSTILSVVKELVNNAVKANLKRLYFKIKGLDINIADEYRKGMETFKKETFQDNQGELTKKLEKSKLVVRLSFKTTGESIHISIINNIPILDNELTKTQSRIKKAYKYNDITEAFEDVLDDSEGAGLGLIMALMLLKNSGLPIDTFRLYRKNDLTIASLNIPQNLTPSESKIKVTEAILSEINEIPSFPENIVEIQRLCGNPDVTMKSIAESISRDPGLTTSILKLANSAGYITIKRVDSIEEAVKIIGIKGINTLLVATGVHKIIDSRYKKYEYVWKNANKKAFYAQKIALQLKLNRIGEFVYLAGLLSDIGKIIMLAINPTSVNQLREIAGFKGLTESDLLEEISLGISHSSLGAMVCQKWKFNEALIKTVDLHNKPHLAPETHRQLIYIVYLADIFCDIEGKKTRFEIVDEDVLEYFRLSARKDFEKLHHVLIDSFNEHLQNISE